MKKHHVLWLLIAAAGLLLVAAGLAGCAPDTTAPELQAQAVEAQLPTDLPDDTVPVSDQPGQAVEVPVFTDTACLDCHTDEDRVQELAVEEEPDEESLSSGPG